MAPRRSARLHATRDTEGLKAAQEVAYEAEKVLGVSHLDPVVGDETPETLNGFTNRDATVWVFAYGANMNRDVLSGRRMIKPAESVPAKLHGYRLSFNQPGLPYREPGFATVEPAPAGHKRSVHGVAHRMTNAEWNYYKESEGAAGQSDQGYGVISVRLEAYDGRALEAYTLQTQPKTLARLRGKDAMPSKRYLNLLRKGANEFALDQEYQDYLNGLQHYEPHGFGGHIGSLITSVIAFGLLFPLFGAMRMYRKIRGLHSVNGGGALARFYAMYFRIVFAFSWALHDVLRPVLGCGCTARADAAK
jgi:hypothetical protein